MPVAFLPFVPVAQAQGGGLGSMLIPLLLIGLITYFMIIRPQARREKARRTMIEAIKKGDKVVTIGGLHGTIVKVEDAAVLLQVDDNTKLRFDKNAIASVAAKEEKAAPARATPAKEAA
ncbi:MAG: preprotein translocase subunit YajC [Rubricoccaceae bacterium]